MLLADCPPGQESATLVVKQRGRFAAQGIRVPRIYASDTYSGFLLLEDFGTDLLSRLVQDHRKPQPWYDKALETLVTIQRSSQQDLPQYDRVLLEEELALFPEWFADRLLQRSLPQRLWLPVVKLLLENALEQPMVLTHRDYHSRNLIALADDDLGVIDFQDAVLGPVSYDLASLLRDSYLQWSATQQRQWMNQYRQLAIAAGVEGTADPRFETWLDLMGAQRQLKILGIFSRLYLRDGKPVYLADIPLTCQHLLEVCSRYPPLQALGNWLNRELPSVHRAINLA